MSVPAGSPLGRVAYAAVFALCTAVAIGWLVLGGAAAVLRYWPGLLDAGLPPERGDALLVAAARASEPLAQLFVDDALSLVGIGAGVVLALMGTRNWTVALLALALVGSAGAFNLQADAVATVLDQATGLPLGATRDIALHALACVAFILALLLFPAPSPAAWWRARAATPGGRASAVAAGGLLLVVVGIAAPSLPCAVSCVGFFGFVVPATGVLVLPRTVRHGRTHGLRSQARLVFAVSVAAIATNSVLGLCTVALADLGAPGLALVGAKGGGSIALLFWSARASAIAIAAAALLAVLRTRPWTAERAVGRGLAAVLTTVVVGGAAAGVEAMGWSSALGGVPSSLLAAATAGVLFLPVHLAVEGLTDRLLYGARPTPYRALADIADLAQASATTGPDLEEVARAVGQALGASECRVTVVRQSLPDRTYRWSASDAESARPMATVPIRHGEEQIGTLAVEQAAVAGLQADRGQLLEDIADGLGSVVASHRVAVELERQMRAALAHGAEIARARRRAVTEMDAERRRIERDLHDGVQHHLVSLRLALGLVEFEAGRGRAAAAQLLESLLERLDTAEAVLAETVGGVQLLPLVEGGLVATLEAELAGSGSVSVVSELPEGRRYPAEVEAAVYFCCLESVGNAAKHAPGASVVVRFAEADGWLRFTVTDDGPGFDLPANPDDQPGRGLRNLRQRIMRAGGWVDIRTAPGAGTTVGGAVAVPPLPSAPEHGEWQPDTDGQTTTLLRIVGPGTASDLPGVSIVARQPYTDRPMREEVPTEHFRTAPGGRYVEEKTDSFACGPATVKINIEKTPRAVEPSTSAQDRSLVGEVRALIAAASTDLGRAVDADLAAVGADLRRRLRVGFHVPDGEDTGLFLRCVFPAGPPPGVELVAAPPADAEGMDALVVVDGGGRGYTAPHSRVPTIAVVNSERPIALPRPMPVLRIGWRTACAAMQLTEADHASLRAGRPVASLGAIGNHVGLALANRAATLAELRTEMVARSRVSALGEALHHQVFARADLLRGRDAIARLTAIVAGMPPGRATERLRYGLEQMTASRPEFAESALLDDLRGGRAALAGPHHTSALRLLGAAGSSPTDRLGLPVSAAPADVEVAASRELARWQRIAANPISSGGQRRAAAVLIRICERILTRRSAVAAGTASDRTVSESR